MPRLRRRPKDVISEFISRLAILQQSMHAVGESIDLESHIRNLVLDDSLHLGDYVVGFGGGRGERLLRRPEERSECFFVGLGEFEIWKLQVPQGKPGAVLGV
jgi:hypothetical protein